ncbi:MAG: dipeptide epimerase [Pirellulaceae bacterium]
MRIADLTAMIVRLRLRKEFKHASFSRSFSDNVLIRCRLTDGTIGWGEGIPRPYVTGESPEGTMRQLDATDLAAQLGASCDNWPDVVRMCEQYRPTVLREDPRGCMANAHRCAVELSILDAFGKLFSAPLSDVITHVPEAKQVHQPSQWVQYSSAISSGGFRKAMLSSLAMRLYGFAQCKVKVGMQSDIDPRRLRWMRRWVGSRMDLRVDANEAWTCEETVSRIEALQPYGISCVEQPVRHADVDGLSKIRSQVKTPLMLDESLTSMIDAEKAIDTGTCDLFNIRLSKCGGFISSLRLAAMANEAGLGYQLGCHPGESGILSAAGRHFATSVGGIRYCEGSADRHLLKDLITQEALTFGRGGWARAIDRPGLGVTICRKKLEPLIQESRTFKIS